MADIKPITPTEAIAKATSEFDPMMIESVNELISEKLSPNDRRIDIKVNEIISRYSSKTERDSSYVYANKLLDFESIYGRAGWQVLYKAPDRDESFVAYFIFEFKKSQ